jgi:hypothetical protein
MRVFLEKRESGSRPDAGIAMSHVELLNQNDEVIVDSISAALIAKRRDPPVDPPER